MMDLTGQRDLIIDLGCGRNKQPGAIGMDNAALDGVDIVHDLLQTPYPFPDGCAKTMYLNHVVEHFDIQDTRRILNEVYRILQLDGVVHVRVPHAFSVAAWIDPTHRTGFMFGSGRYFDSTSQMAYYKELDAVWRLVKTSSRVTWWNWKSYRFRRIDAFLSRLPRAWIDWLLRRSETAADLFVRWLPMFFVEIRWELMKTTAKPDESA
jgi:SAM-dependent methyltransferase